MEKRQEKKALNTLIALLDLLLTILAFLVGYMIRDNAIVGKPFFGLVGIRLDPVGVSPHLVSFPSLFRVLRREENG